MTYSVKASGIRNEFTAVQPRGTQRIKSNLLIQKPGYVTTQERMKTIQMQFRDWRYVFTHTTLVCNANITLRMLPLHSTFSAT